MKHIEKVIKIGLLSLCVGLWACKDWQDLADVKQGTWKSEWAIPVLDADLSLADMVTKKKGKLEVLEDANGFYTFLYTNEFKSATAETYLVLPSQQLDTVRFQAPSDKVGAIPPNITFSLADQNKTTDFVAATSDQQLRFIDLKAGKLKFLLSSTFKHNVSLTVTIPSLTKNGVAFSRNYTLSSNGLVAPSPSSDNLELAGYRLDLSNGLATGYNKISYQVKATVQTVGNSVSASDQIKIALAVENPKFSYIEGYLGKFSVVNRRDSVFISIFDSKLAGQIFVEDPKLRITVSNSYGVALRARVINRVGRANYTADSVLTFKGADLLNPFDVAAALRGQTAIKIVEVNKSNSNIQGILNPAPREIIYDASAEINGQTTTIQQNNFALDTSRIGVKGEVEIPLEGRTMEFYTIHDSSDSQLPVNNNIEDLQMNIYAKNGFPVEVDIQVYFLDANEKPIDSIITGRGEPGKEFLLRKATDKDGNGRIDVYESEQTERQFIMNSQRYAFLRDNSKKIRIFGRLRSDGAEQGKSIKIYSYYRFRLKMGVIMNLRTGG